MPDIDPVREEPLCDPPAVLLPVEPVVLPVVDPVAEPVLEEPVLPAPVLEEPLYDPPARFCTVPFTSTRLPTSVEKFDALPVKRYDVALLLIVELLPVEPAPVVLPVALPAVLPVGLAVDPVVPVADPVVDEEPAPIEASVRM
jgi:fused signal recognition particle receptor